MENKNSGVKIQIPGKALREYRSVVRRQRLAGDEKIPKRKIKIPVGIK